MPTLSSRVVWVLFFFINLTPQAYCTTVRGLKIDPLGNLRTEERHSSASTPISNLTQIIGREHTSTIEDVAYTLLQDDVSFADTDTDDEEENTTQDIALKDLKSIDDSIPGATLDIKELNKYNRSRSKAPRGKNEDYKPKNNYLKPDFVVEELRTQLSRDAFDMVGSEANDQTKKSTVCLCVALRDKHEHVKKFVFHNGEHIMSRAMRNKAHTLGYDVIQVEQSHAEGQLMQFLLRRHQVRPGWYTHIMGMGCSKCHCAECNVLFKLFLGEGYHAVTASVNDKKGEINSTVTTSVTSESRGPGEASADENKKFTQIITLRTEYEVVEGSGTVDSASYDNYYLPENLQEGIRRRTGLNLDFSDNRFSKGEEKKRAEKEINSRKDKRSVSMILCKLKSSGI